MSWLDKLKLVRRILLAEAQGNEHNRPMSSNGTENWNRIVIRRVCPGLRGRNPAVLPRVPPELGV
jgi:hypothetical protein